MDMKKCCQCGGEFKPKRIEQRYCSTSCANVLKGRNSGRWMKGKRNAWKDGRRKDVDGYIRIYNPTTQSYHREHRQILMAEESQIVHHVNGIPNDNRPENLDAMTRSDHSRHHAKDRQYTRDEKGQFSHA